MRSGGIVDFWLADGVLAGRRRRRCSNGGQVDVASALGVTVVFNDNDGD